MERAELLCALFVDAPEGGDLDENELLLLATSVEFGNTRGCFLLLSLLPPRLDLFALDDDVCLERFRFSRAQLVSLVTELQIPERFTALCRTTLLI